MTSEVHEGNEDPSHEAAHKGNALPHNVHLAVPIGSVLMLILVAYTTANPGEITTIFIPVFLFMVIVYVFASMYLFKRIIDKDQSATTDQQSHVG